MTAQAIYRRWRPQSFEDVIGQDHITQTLRNAVRGDRLAHAYLFTGPRGTGKTSVARILAKAVCCTEDSGADKPCNACDICLGMTAGRALDLIEIDAASNTGVDDVRDLREKIGFAPNEARYKVYIIDEVHMLSTAAFNALLKTLEEPPPHAIFVLATTEPHKIPDTILSRCQRHDFRRVDVAGVAGKLARICEVDGAEAESDALELIARSGTGSIRDAESLLDQLIATGERITVEAVREVLGTPADEAVADLVDALLAQDPARGLALINATLDRGTDPRQLQDRLLDHLRAILLIQTGLDEALLNQPEDRLVRLRAQATALPMAELVKAIHRFNDARPAANRALPSLPLELALVETALALTGDDAATQRPPPASTTPTPSTDPPREAPSEPDTAESEDPKRVAAEPASAEDDKVAQDGTASLETPDDAGAADPGGRAADPAEPITSAAEATETPSKPDPVEGGMAELEHHRPAILSAVERDDRNLAALLKDCRPLAAAAGEVTLGFFYDFHHRRASQAEKQQRIAAAIEGVLGRPVTLRCTVVSETQSEAAKRPRSKTDQASKDPVVKHALDKLGARISGVQEDPQDD